MSILSSGTSILNSAQAKVTLKLTAFLFLLLNGVTKNIQNKLENHHLENRLQKGLPGGRFFCELSLRNRKFPNTGFSQDLKENTGASIKTNKLPLMD